MAKKDFTRAQERYADGELVLMIDGSGGMPHAFRSNEKDQNPFVVAVDFAKEAKLSAPANVSAYVFGEPEGPFRLPLDEIDDPLKHMPCGSSRFLPAFEEIEGAYRSGAIKNPAHIVIVSDGDIYETGRDDFENTVKKLTDFLREYPETMFDVIIPRAEKEKTPLVEMMQLIARNLDDKPPRIYEVDDVTKLRKTIADVINERTDAVKKFEDTVRTGTENSVKTMTLRLLRKPPETV